jgi:NAD-dependent SIR2 family protein deacetylase
MHASGIPNPPTGAQQVHAQRLSEFLQQHAPVMILSGAGISTDSGIPDYRDSLGNWKRRQPVQHQDFLNNLTTRQRYWARSLVGWPLMQQARPNTAHFQIAALESRGLVSHVVTQNVDRLHQKAGSDQAVDLHGRADEIICVSCDYRESRQVMHEYCAALNPAFTLLHAGVAPDGDADLETDFSGFRVPACPVCNGILKPDVVFFGDNVPRARVDAVFEGLRASRGLLVIGSSLMVFSGFRFCREAHRQQIPLAILTQGVTRADDLASLKLDNSIAGTLESTMHYLSA